MSVELNDRWHHECTGCGVFIAYGFDVHGVPQPMPMPTEPGPDEVCPLCGGAWGPWQPGPAPEDDDDE